MYEYVFFVHILWPQVEVPPVVCPRGRCLPLSTVWHIALQYSTVSRKYHLTLALYSVQCTFHIPNCVLYICDCILLKLKVKCLFVPTNCTFCLFTLPTVHNVLVSCPFSATLSRTSCLFTAHCSKTFPYYPFSAQPT